MMRGFTNLSYVPLYPFLIMRGNGIVLVDIWTKSNGILQKSLFVFVSLIMALYFTPSKTMVSHTQGHPLLHALAVSVTLNYSLAFTQPAFSMKDETTFKE